MTTIDEAEFQYAAAYEAWRLGRATFRELNLVYCEFLTVLKGSFK